MDKQKRFNNARNIILVVLLCTIASIAMIAVGSDTMFLFSASIPFYFAIEAILYEFIFGYVIAVVSSLALVGCWFLAKDRILGLVLAIVYFILDSLFLLWLFDFELSIIAGELLFHAIIISYLVYGIIIFPKQKSLEDELLGEITEKANTTPIGYAEDVKARIFLEDDILGRHVVYRRVKSVNQLVIDGKVYDEYKAVMELPHELKANIDGHIYKAGTDGSSMMFLAIDEERVKIKRRWI